MLAGRLYRQIRDRFRALGIANPELDARLLVSAAIGMLPSDLMLGEDMPVSAANAVRAEAFADLRATGMPPGRILGEREFYGRRFLLNEATLEPRQDTEILVDVVLARSDADQPMTVVDIGTGTGAIAISLLAERPKSLAVATDISAKALECARSNAKRLGVSERFMPVCADYMAPLAAGPDWIVSNPPYIRSDELAGLDREVIQFDPVLALDGGADGLSGYSCIVAGASELLDSSGKIAFEIGFDQAGDVKEILLNHGFTGVEVIRDLAGRDRVIAARKK